MKPQVCVEIGSAQGRSACFTALGLSENGSGKLYAIDPHIRTQWNDGPLTDTFKIINRNLKAGGYAGVVEIIRTTSDEAARNWTRKIDLLFIDGDHTYEGVKHDWELFSPFVRPFGLVIFHDTAWEFEQYNGRRREDLGVPQFVDELRRDGYQILTINQDFGVSLVQPVKGGNPLLPNNAGVRPQGV
jgi:predicted O-methyltransferase YrrM